MNQPADTNDLPVRVRRAAWLARAAFLLVFAINVQCAASFVLLARCLRTVVRGGGVPGAAAVQGLGIAFLMWNATYPAVIASPLRFRAVAVIVLVQQAIGLAGESWLRFGLPAGHAALSASIERFTPVARARADGGRLRVAALGEACNAPDLRACNAPGSKWQKDAEFGNHRAPQEGTACLYP